MRMFNGRKKGLSLMEVILVVVIVGVAAALAAPNVRTGIENRQAVQATETLKSIFHAIRMYEVDRGSLPADLKALEDAGYLQSTEYAYKRKPDDTDSNGFEYTITTSPRCAVAERFTITTTVIPGECHQECHWELQPECHQECDDESGCDGCGGCNCHQVCQDVWRWICKTVCLPDTVKTTKNSIKLLQVCE